MTDFRTLMVDSVLHRFRMFPALEANQQATRHLPYIERLAEYADTAVPNLALCHAFPRGTYINLIGILGDDVVTLAAEITDPSPDPSRQSLVVLAANAGTFTLVTRNVHERPPVSDETVTLTGLRATIVLEGGDRSSARDLIRHIATASNIPVY